MDETDIAVDAETLVEVGRYLHDKGYQFVTPTPVTQAHNLLRGSLATDLRDIFGWNRPFKRSLISADDFRMWERAGILERYDGHWRSKIRWSSLSDWLLAHSPYPTIDSSAVFFGPDTYRFVRFIMAHLKTFPVIHRAVDIGTGSGAGAMTLAKHLGRAEVVAVDINRKALKMCRVNTRLAGMNDISTMRSDLLSAVEGGFDLMVANPPYLLDALDRIYRHGGGHLGEGLSRRIVEVALDRLNPGGTLLLYTGTAIVDGRDSFRSGLEALLINCPCDWHYDEIDPDVFSEQLHVSGYESVERIAVVGLTLTMHP